MACVRKIKDDSTLLWFTLFSRMKTSLKGFPWFRRRQFWFKESLAKEFFPSALPLVIYQITYLYQLILLILRKWGLVQIDCFHKALMSLFLRARLEGKPPAKEGTPTYAWRLVSSSLASHENGHRLNKNKYKEWTKLLTRLEKGRAVPLGKERMETKNRYQEGKQTLHRLKKESRSLQLKGGLPIHILDLLLMNMTGGIP